VSNLSKKPDNTTSVKGVIFDLDGTLLDSMHFWVPPLNYKKIAARYRDEATLKPGVYEFLSELRRNKVKIVLATATDRDVMEPALHRTRIYDFFDEIFTCGEVGEGKHSPLIYRKALAFLGCDKSQVLVFEDAHYAITTASDDGFRVVAVADEWVHLYGEMIAHEEVLRRSEMFVADYRELRIAGLG